MSDPETADVEVLIMKESDKAFLLQSIEEPEKESWFPKSEVVFNYRNIKTGKATANIPIWLLAAKGW